ncbi:unnamed protein product [marine sediment metagenome]|uniref:Uncharacterized protein n=1 Tax=marine sediment metagenome TaxID=412755 RepID=X1ME45_9ZZZZ
MIRINLFPFRAARIKENIRRQITYYFGSVIIILLAITYFYMNFSKQINSLSHVVVAPPYLYIDRYFYKIFP